MKRPTTWVMMLAMGSLLAGCVLAPREAKDQQKQLDKTGESTQFSKSFEERELPEVPESPTWQQLLHRALLANGEIEAAYHEWAMAVAKIDQQGAYPNSPVMVSLEYMLSPRNMKAWDRTTVMAGTDPMEPLAFPSKPYQSAKVAWRDAQAAGERFRTAKFAVQRDLLRMWIDYCLTAEKIRIQRETVSLLRMISDTAVARVQAGGNQQDLLRAEIEFRMAESELADMEAELAPMRARLNAMLGRAVDSPLEAPAEMPPARNLPADDATLLSLAVDRNPELAALAHEVQGGKDALERAKMEYIPDISPSFGITGDMERFIGAAITFPTVLPRIRAMVREARSDIARTEAMLRQKKLDQAAEFVAALYALRNAERQADTFERHVLPGAQRVLDSARESYAAGTGMYLDLIESQRTLLEVRLLLAEARAEREKRLADLEALAAVDIETLDQHE